MVQPADNRRRASMSKQQDMESPTADDEVYLVLTNVGNMTEIEFQLRDNIEFLLTLPWHMELRSWDPKLKLDLERGLSRHDVIFVETTAILAIKQLPDVLARKESEVLQQCEDLNLPCVRSVGYVIDQAQHRSFVITEYLNYSMPYRTIFMRHGLQRYHDRLIDALAILLVTLHLNGFFWGDCSLSNILFRRDASELQAYLVDAETSELHPTLSDQRRAYDLEIMETNIYGDLLDVSKVVQLPGSLDIETIGPTITDRYSRLWSLLTTVQTVDYTQSYRLQEFIRSINDLGFAVDEMEIDQLNDKISFRPIVTDRNHHRHYLQNLTGIVAEELQARLILNDIHEYRIMVSQQLHRSVGIQETSHRWLAHVFLMTMDRLADMTGDTSPAELYCQVLEHKWFLSEQQQRDVGLDVAIADYLIQMSS